MIAAVVYNADGVTEYDDLAAARAARGTTWVRAAGVSPSELERAAAVFDVHPLVVEDVFNNVRLETEPFDGYTFTLLESAELARGDQIFEEEVLDEPVGVCLGSDWVLTMTTTENPRIGRVWQAVVRGDERLLQRGPDFTACRVLDVVVDGYYDLLDTLEDSIELIEEDATVSTEIETLEAINAIRQDLLAFRKVVWPGREAVGVLSRGDPPRFRTRRRSTCGTSTTTSSRSPT